MYLYKWKIMTIEAIGTVGLTIGFLTVYEYEGRSLTLQFIEK